jgi:hypothetical protein
MCDSSPPEENIKQEHVTGLTGAGQDVSDLLNSLQIGGSRVFHESSDPSLPPLEVHRNGRAP